MGGKVAIYLLLLDCKMKYYQNEFGRRSVLIWLRYFVLILALFNISLEFCTGGVLNTKSYFLTFNFNWFSAYHFCIQRLLQCKRLPIIFHYSKSWKGTSLYWSSPCRRVFILLKRTLLYAISAAVEWVCVL